MSAISKALELCARAEPWWPYPLAIALHDAQHGLAFLWVSRCVRKLLPLVGSSKEAQLLLDLDRLDALANDPPVRDEICNFSREIWYRPDRDAAQTAVAKLYEAFTVHLDAPDRCNSIAMGAPINNLIFRLAPQSWNDRTIELRTIVINEFRVVAAEHNVENAE